MQQDTIIAAILGLLEGLTEFIPVSSTGHLLLAGHFLGFDSPGRAFEVLIQLGAIMAILGVYARRLWGIFSSAPHDPVARRFILSILLAFMPAVVIGVMAHGFIKEVLFETPMLVAAMLILGGIVLLIVDRLAINPTYERPEDFPPTMAFKIGVIQCFAMIPGVSRSGATIVGGLMLGADKRAAAEFSFFLSMPTMAGAFAYDLYKNRDVLDAAAGANIMLGFACAMMAAVVVVRWLLEYVSRNGYAVFAWWRIGIGIIAMSLLAAGL